MERNEQDLLKLISDYISCANYSCELFRNIYSGNETLLHAYAVLKLIPKEGYIEGVYYNFHGIGCYFEYPDKSEIDIDFGPGGICGGFDLYRIGKFLKFRKEKYGNLIDEAILKKAFENLIDNKIIKKHADNLSGHLYYLDVRPS